MDYSGGHIGDYIHLHTFTHFYTLHFFYFTFYIPFYTLHKIEITFYYYFHTTSHYFTLLHTTSHYFTMNKSHSFTLSLSHEGDSWDYEFPIILDRTKFTKKNSDNNNNETNNEKEEKEAFDKLSKFLCLQMKQHIQDDLINKGKRDILPELEKIFPKFHIHGLTAHEILYPNDPSNSDHCRGDRKIFICTHC